MSVKLPNKLTLGRLASRLSPSMRTTTSAMFAREAYSVGSCSAASLARKRPTCAASAYRRSLPARGIATSAWFAAGDPRNSRTVVVAADSVCYRALRLQRREGWCGLDSWHSMPPDCTAAVVVSGSHTCRRVASLVRETLSAGAPVC